MQLYSKIVAFKLTTENGLPGTVRGSSKATNGSNRAIKEDNGVVLVVLGVYGYQFVLFVKFVMTIPYRYFTAWKSM